MATIPDAVITVEEILHRAVKEIAQNTYDTHGVMVDAIQIDWARCPGVISEPVRFRVGAIDIHTSTEYRDG